MDFGIDSGEGFRKVCDAIDALQSLEAADEPCKTRTFHLDHASGHYNPAQLHNRGRLDIRNELVAGLLLDMAEAVSVISEPGPVALAGAIRIDPDDFPGALKFHGVLFSFQEQWKMDTGNEKAFIEIDRTGIRFVCEDVKTGERTWRTFACDEFRELLHDGPDDRAGEKPAAPGNPM